MAQIGSDTFSLHPQLASDTRPVATLTLSDLLLINDSRYLWCILVPRLADLRDLHDLPRAHKTLMHEEIDCISVVVKDLAQAHKMNVAALGNVVEQLHVHIIARHRDDAAWPAPVWGVGTAEPYTEDSANKLIRRLRDSLQL